MGDMLKIPDLIANSGVRRLVKVIYRYHSADIKMKFISFGTNKTGMNLMIFFIIDGKLSVIRCYTFFSMADVRTGFNSVDNNRFRRHTGR